MSEENLGDALDTEYATHQKDIAVKTLGSRTHLSIAKIAKLLEHKEHGATIGAITLDELLAVSAGVVVDAPAAPAPKAKAAKAKAAPKAPKAAKAKPAKKQAKAKTNGAAKAAKPKGNGAAKPKAGKGSKPRLVRDVAYKEVKAALKATKGGSSNGDIVKKTDYTAVQVRTFLNELIEKGEVTYQGKGRGTKYDLA